MQQLIEQLPQDMVYYILTFDENFVMRGNQLLSRFDKKDPRYDLLQTIPTKNDLWTEVYVSIPFHGNSAKEFFIHLVFEDKNEHLNVRPIQIDAYIYYTLENIEDDKHQELVDEYIYYLDKPLDEPLLSRIDNDVSFGHSFGHSFQEYAN
jgi:hypothetical protein